MPSVGTAYVNVRVSTKGFEDSLKSMLGRLSTTMNKEGEKLGKDFERGFKNGSKDTFKSLETDAARSVSKVTTELDKVGEAGKRMGRDVASGSRDARAGMQDLVDDLGDVHRAEEEVTRSAKRAESALSGAGSAGGRAGGGFRRAAGGAGQFDDALSRLASHGPSASRILNRFYNLNAFGGTAIAAAVGGLSAAAQGIFAVGANAAAAAPSLAVMANGLMSLGQVGGVVAIAMHGVSDALSAGFKSVAPAASTAGSAATGMGKATAAAARAVRDAKQGLQDAYRDAARAAQDAAQRVADAEANLAAAQRESEAAQRALNDARQEGIEQMEDIAFAAEEAGLAEQRAKLDLADAQQALIETSELAPDDRARVEAELAFKEAELRMREATDRREDADKAQRKSAKEGVEGTDAMKDAHDELAQAQENEADAERELYEARRDAARQAQDSARAIADAQQAVADAQRGLADAMKGGTGAIGAQAKAVDAYQQALDKLSPEQRKFVERIISMRDTFKSARDQIADPLFAGLNQALTDLTRGGMFDILVDGLTDTSKALGNVIANTDKGVDSFGELSKDPIFQDSFASAMESNNEAIGHFGGAAVSLADAFVQVADAAGPLFVKFSKWVESVAQGWSETTRLKNSTGDLQGTIERAGDRVERFWNLFKELWRTLRLVGGAASEAADKFKWTDQKGRDREGYIPALTNALKRFNNQLDTTDGRESMFDDFTQSLKTLNAAGRAFKNAVLDPLQSMGTDKSLETTFDKISKSDAFQRIADNATEAAPLLADVALNILDIIAALSESDSINWFFKTLKVITGMVKFIVDNPIAGAFLGAAGIIFGIRRALTLTQAVAKVMFAPAAQALDNIRRKAGRIKVGTTGGVGAAAAAPSKVAGAGAEASEGTWEAEVLVHLKGIITAVETCCATLSRAMGAAAGGEMLGAAPRAGAAGAVAGGGATLGLAAGETAKVGKFAGAMGKLGKVFGPATKLLKPLSVGFRLLGGAFRFMLGPWGLIIFTLLPLLWPLLKKLDEKFHILDKTIAAFKWTLDILTDAFMWLWDNALKPFFGWIADNAGSVWDKITDAFNKTVDALGWMWDKVKDVFGWFKSNWPLLLGIITGPIGLAVVLVIKYWDQILAFVKGVPGKITAFLSGMWDLLMTGLEIVWDKVVALWGTIIAWVKRQPNAFKQRLKNLWNMFRDGLKIVWGKVKEIWGRVVDWVKGRPQQFANNLKALWNIFKDGLQTAYGKVKNLWNTITTWVKGRPAQFKKNLSKIWDALKDKLKDTWDWVVKKWGNIKKEIKDWPGDVTEKLKGIFKGLASGIKTAWNWVVGQINDKVIGGINNILDKFGIGKISISINTIGDIPEMAAGGPIRGPGGPTDDRVPIMASNGEYMMPAKASRKLGRRALDYMRKFGELPPGTGIGGIFGAIGSAFGSLAGALKDGVGTALKWILDKATDALHSDESGFLGDAMSGMFKKYAGGMIDWLTKKLPQWHYPVSRHVPISQWPNTGHSPPNSMDFDGVTGDAVLAAGTGRVSYVRHLTTSYGNHLLLTHPGGISTLYAHLASVAVNAGQSVVAGQKLGMMGTTGNSTGVHLHFEVRGDGATDDFLRKHGIKLAHGGVVSPSPSGTLAVIAEAGKSERVTPLDSEGFTPAERRILEALEAQFTGGGGGDTIHVHPSERMNEVALADMVARRVAWRRRRGSGTR